ncbi:Ca2+-dependent phosphoinositide-specific phospholipase C [Streptomyces herbicida]|uniref:Ca2+-dependent phosphoinositide-specific phospholipase C n=1 Tax=Streptomyces herbicida TaxID=3065675 RepID=UPI0029311A16|nr:Ca2+-dependent phosphoinositide-specific phospholipase C [Streptomyces sp. NEAU-HV9]
MATALALDPAPSHAASGFDDTALDGVAVSGLHNAYDPAKSNRLTKELDKGAHLLEIDVYTTYGGSGGWVVSHSDPLSNENNCTYTTGSGIFKTTWRNGSLRTCLDNLSDWSHSHPDHDPIYVKLELKWGFRSTAGMGPADLDHLIKNHIGAENIFKPADMVGKKYPDLDTAAKAGAWPTWRELRGKFVFYPITGTIENRLADYDLDNLSTAEEYARRIRDLAAAGSLDQAMMWPDTHPTSGGGDPREVYDPSLRPWFVLFDDQAADWLSGTYDLSWYCANHYLTVATAAESLAPALDATNPDPDAATERVRHIAQDGRASVTTFDWMNTPGAFAVQARGCSHSP